MPLFLLVLFGSLVAAQEAVKIADDTKYVTYEYQRGVIDILLTTMEHDVNSKGVIVIHPTANDPVFPYLYKNLVLNHLAFRSKLGMIVADRVELVLGDNSAEFRVEMWKIPDGGSKQFISKPWDYKLPELKRTLLVHTDGWLDGIPYGGSSPSIEFYSNFLLANDLVGRVIIKDSSYSNYKKRRKVITEELVKKYKVPQKNLEFAFMESEESDAEYWLMPKSSN